MVKNTTGGSKHKGQARKNVIGRNSNNSLRLVENDGECYAHVEKILGGPHMHVTCMDGKTRLCTIRGKFRGRGKRDNRLDSGTWVMVGLRDYETVRESGTKLENCDLLEVYKDGDKDRLRNTARGENWTNFVARDMERSHVGKDASADTFRFITDEEIEMDDFIAKSVETFQEQNIDDDDYNLCVEDDTPTKLNKNIIIGRPTILDEVRETEEDVEIDDI